MLALGGSENDPFGPRVCTGDRKILEPLQMDSEHANFEIGERSALSVTGDYFRCVHSVHQQKLIPDSNHYSVHGSFYRHNSSKFALEWEGFQTQALGAPHPGS